MKSVLFSCGLFLTASLALAQSSPADDVSAAARKVADKAGYHWVAKTEYAGGQGGGPGRMGPTEGWRNKDGWTLVKATRGETTTEIVMKGDKAAYKGESGWQAVDLSDQGGGGGGGGGQPNPGRTAARLVRSFKAPSVEAAELASKARDLKKEGDSISGTLPEETAKSYMTFGRGRGGGGGPEISGAKGTVKFWIQEGTLTKYEYSVQGSMNFNGEDRKIDRTTTVELKDGGPAADAIPDAAKKLAS